MYDAGTGRTVYMSSMDYVLEASAIFHQDDRAGQVWPRLLAVDYILRRPFVLVPGTDSIDCSGDMLACDALQGSRVSSLPCAVQCRLYRLCALYRLTVWT